MTARMAAPGVVTEYFELDSAHVGTRFAISVSLPPTYALTDDTHPLVYATDGNAFGPLMEAARAGLVGAEAVRPVQPFVQVSIGYPPDVAPQLLVLRNRDLVPPGEGYPAFMPAHIHSRLGVAQGLMPESAVDAFFEQQRAARADRFLTFVEDELHPEITRRYRVRTGETGLFGYSYGGLFTLYALTSGSRLFTRFGASSPGILVPDSRIYALYDELVAGGADLERHLHLTVSSYEMLGPVALYRTLGLEFLRFYGVLQDRPPARPARDRRPDPGRGPRQRRAGRYRSFLRTCYPEKMG